MNEISLFILRERLKAAIRVCLMRHRIYIPISSEDVDLLDEESLISITEQACLFAMLPSSV